MINIFETSFEARERRFQIEKLYHGETVDLVGVVTTNGVPQNITGYSVSGVFQPTSMNGSPDFYELSADIVENKVIVHWEKGKDFGENSYMVWALLTDGDNASYPIAWRLDMAYSPSFPLSALDPIPKAIDFSKYELLNAPWAMLSDFQDFQEVVSETYATKNEVAEGLAALSDEYEPIGAEDRAKQYTDEKASKYLPLSGGTMGGNIIVQPTKYFETREDDGNDGYYSVKYTGTIIDTRGSPKNGILRFPDGSGTLALEENVQQSIDALSDEYEPKGAEGRAIAAAETYTDEQIEGLSDEYATKAELTGYAKEDELSDYVKMENGVVPELIATDLTSNYVYSLNGIYSNGFASDNGNLTVDNGITAGTSIETIYLTIDELKFGGWPDVLTSLNDLAWKDELSNYAQTSALTAYATTESLTAYASASDLQTLSNSVGDINTILDSINGEVI